jgi:hypothetical protein
MAHGRRRSLFYDRVMNKRIDMNHKKLLSALFLAFLTFWLAACQSTAHDVAEIPVGKAYANGETIFFTHTEASDKGVADLLTKMMNSPVLYVPSLAQVTEAMSGYVYVFKNGVSGSGPLKFQADVFENTPDDPAYTPLRQIIFVTWKEGSQAKELKSAAEIQSLVAQNSVTLEKSGIVVNMPFITWKGGKR